MSGVRRLVGEITMAGEILPAFWKPVVKSGVLRDGDLTVGINGDRSVEQIRALLQVG